MYTDYQLYQILESNGYMTDNENLQILKEGIEDGSIILEASTGAKRVAGYYRATDAWRDSGYTGKAPKEISFGTDGGLRNHHVGKTLAMEIAKAKKNGQSREDYLKKHPLLTDKYGASYEGREIESANKVATDNGTVEKKANKINSKIKEKELDSKGLKVKKI